MQNFKILLVDNNNSRRQKIVKNIKENDLFLLVDKYEISQQDYESCDCDVCIVHKSNDEGNLIEDDIWQKPESVVLVIFSGGTNKEKNKFEGIYYLNGNFIENKKKMLNFLNELYGNRHKL